jgi:hypothetical protein
MLPTGWPALALGSGGVCLMALPKTDRATLDPQEGGTNDTSPERDNNQFGRMSQLRINPDCRNRLE